METPPLSVKGCKIEVHAWRSGRDLYRVTPKETRGFGLYGLIRKTGTHVPQWDSNPRHKDYQISAPNSPTTAPRGRLTFHIKFYFSSTKTLVIVQKPYLSIYFRHFSVAMRIIQIVAVP
jgi:hypothetical protein